jgi:peptidoglycan hydrolase CwlO-like protein
MKRVGAYIFGALACLGVLFHTPVARADMTDSQRATLQTQLDQINAEIQQSQGELATKQKERTSLERDVAILDAKILMAKLSIKERDLTLQQIQNNIKDKEQGINALDTRAAKGQESLAQILRHTREIDDTSLAVLALGGTLSDLFTDIDNFQTIQKALGNAFTEMATVRADLSARKQALEDQQQEEQDLRQIQVLQQKELQGAEKEKKDLVTSARGQESVYLQLISSKQRSAEQIRAALFSLRDTGAVSFGDISSYAREAGKKTGVRPALILGILSEESNLGQNLGSGNWRVDMNPTRDQPIFQQICAGLGLNPDSQPVSKKPWYGWGGAMGPAQFIPSTWQLYSQRIASATGQNPPSPWDARTATYATALLMMDNGADEQTPQAERRAALRYLAGWKNAGKSAYAFYGDAVMELAAKFQSQIDIVGG